MKSEARKLTVKKLTAWYHRNKRDLPWRSNPHPYWVWLAEVMSQQTQIAALLPYFYRFIKEFPNVDSLAKAREDEVMGLWAGLGYYSRARNLHKAAKLVAKLVTEQGHFPKSVEDWMKLPGIGHYTAAAIASQVSGIREPVFDGNVLRVTARLLAVSDAHTAKFRLRAMSELREWIAGADASSFNQAMMELGATVCTRVNPRCDLCPLRAGCKGRKNPEHYPAKKKIKNEILVCARSFIIEKNGKILFVERTPGDWFSSLWDLPSELGGVKHTVRKFKRASRAKKLGSIKHSITHHKIVLELFLASRSPLRGVPKNQEKWIDVADIPDLISKQGKMLIPISTTAKKALKLYLKSRK